jgi:hypothetical protein
MAFAIGLPRIMRLCQFSTLGYGLGWPDPTKNTPGAETKTEEPELLIRLQMS